MSVDIGARRRELGKLSLGSVWGWVLVARKGDFEAISIKMTPGQEYYVMTFDPIFPSPTLQSRCVSSLLRRTGSLHSGLHPCGSRVKAWQNSSTLIIDQISLLSGPDWYGYSSELVGGQAAVQRPCIHLCAINRHTFTSLLSYGLTLSRSHLLSFPLGLIPTLASQTGRTWLRCCWNSFV